MSQKRVIIEVLIPAPPAGAALAANAPELSIAGFTVDSEFSPVPMASPPAQIPDGIAASISAGTIMAVSGTINEADEEAIRDDSRVLAIWSDPDIEPCFPTPAEEKESRLNISSSAAAPASPISPFECDISLFKGRGTIDGVRTFLEIDKIWAKGFKGKDVVIGICDVGVRKGTVPNVIGGWAPPGATPLGDNNAEYHGTMCAVEALSMCPDAKILDIGILKAQSVGFLRNSALAGYQFALDWYRNNGKPPMILSNSWALYAATAADYAKDANHPLTRKIKELIDEGVLVVFAAGNCGAVCPSDKCKSLTGTWYTGPGNSIWGANSHPDVICVGAATIPDPVHSNQVAWCGYSSQGAGALHNQKPDICAPSNFKNFFGNDPGTSVSCPIVAGVLGLFLSKSPKLTQAQAKTLLQNTAKQFGGVSTGWNAQTGFGMINPMAAFNKL